MAVVEENIEESALALVHLRNNFYRTKLRQIIGIYLLSLCVIGILISIIVYLVEHPTQPIYFPADNVGRLIQEVSIQQPNMTQDEIIVWVVNAVQESYSYNYLNFHKQLQDAQKYFTDYGWRNYMQGLQESNNLLALNQYKYVIIAHVTAVPKLMTQGLLEGAASWKFQMPVLIQYWMPPYNEKSHFENAQIVTVIVQRRNVLQSYKGLGIVQMNATLAQ